MDGVLRWWWLIKKIVIFIFWVNKKGVKYVSKQTKQNFKKLCKTLLLLHLFQVDLKLRHFNLKNINFNLKKTVIRM